ncbi:MAG TPA: hypothetical protein VK541_15960 [Pedobacter sp.]|uniref:hypothetical protein n=1 Tax=Pedobacter sp. TaxID=1411316 RepID=UPI002C9A9579|nr:hypothetical protein [Pedobacter sp.]HMI03982.1 hypothetical protein [Pedobacter sp.]
MEVGEVAFKTNVGAVILHDDRIKAAKAIEQTLGSVKFNDTAFFSANAKAVFPY